jgi:hypothetical protein
MRHFFPSFWSKVFVGVHTEAFLSHYSSKKFSISPLNKHPKTLVLDMRQTPCEIIIAGSTGVW